MREPPAGKLWNNNNSAAGLRNSSSAATSADRLSRDSAHPNGRPANDARQSSVVRRSSNVRMRERDKLTGSEPWISKQPSGAALQSHSAQRSKSGGPIASTRR